MRRTALVALAAVATATLGSTAAKAMDAPAGSTTDRWAACATVDVRVNLTDAPAGALADVKKAITEVDSATGLHLRYAGPTALVPNGDNWLATGGITLAWAGQPGSDKLDGSNAGQGGYVADGSAIRSGFVVLDTHFNGLPGGFGAGGTRGALLMHELGHAVGLRHSADPRDIMYPTVTTKTAAWGSGDRAALASVGTAVGQSGCNCGCQSR